jgi:hypothetical protein
MPAALCARAVVRDVRSGRRALLWDSRKAHTMQSSPLNANHRNAEILPQGSMYVSNNYLVLARDMMSPFCNIGERAYMGIGFYVRPEAGQEGVPARDKLWRLAGGDGERYGEHESFAGIVIQPCNMDAIRRTM